MMANYVYFWGKKTTFIETNHLNNQLHCKNLSLHISRLFYFLPELEPLFEDAELFSWLTRSHLPLDLPLHYRIQGNTEIGTSKMETFLPDVFWEWTWRLTVLRCLYYMEIGRSLGGF